jgi:cellulose synthase/poly-beta-1,6-N-acetylglucosamine synthase-like glycosyltransferase
LQDYPPGLFEVILTDDHSSDDTVKIAQGIRDERLRILQMKDVTILQETKGPVQAFKKIALEWGIQHARGDLILTTDGDCVLPPNWLRNMAYAFEAKGWQCITGPVLFYHTRNLLQRFQSLDFMGMMLLTGAGVSSGLTHLANGAAFGFSRKAFFEVNGYAGNKHLASGDDLFLLHKIMALYPGQVGFIKTAEAVQTEAPETLLEFMRQRLRWGTKSTAYRDRRITFVLALVFFHCWGILLTFLAIPFQPKAAAVLLLLQTGIKAMADYRMLHTAAVFFNRRDAMRSFWPAQGAHILYIAGVGLGANLFRRYRWKGRIVR